MTNISILNLNMVHCEKNAFDKNAGRGGGPANLTKKNAFKKERTAFFWKRKPFFLIFASGGVCAPDFIPPRRGAVLMWGEEEIREVAMLLVRYNIINGI